MSTCCHYIVLKIYNGNLNQIRWWLTETIMLTLTQVNLMLGLDKIYSLTSNFVVVYLWYSTCMQVESTPYSGAGELYRKIHNGKVKIFSFIKSLLHKLSWRLISRCESMTKIEYLKKTSCLQILTKLILMQIYPKA